jgi:hypothetical protein
MRTVHDDGSLGGYPRMKRLLLPCWVQSEGRLYREANL